MEVDMRTVTTTELKAHLGALLKSKQAIRVVRHKKHIATIVPHWHRRGVCRTAKGQCASSADCGEARDFLDEMIAEEGASPVEVISKRLVEGLISEES